MNLYLFKTEFNGTFCWYAGANMDEGYTHPTRMLASRQPQLVVMTVSKHRLVTFVSFLPNKNNAIHSLCPTSVQWFFHPLGCPLTNTPSPLTGPFFNKRIIGAGHEKIPVPRWSNDRERMDFVNHLVTCSPIRIVLLFVLAAFLIGCLDHSLLVVARTRVLAFLSCLIGCYL